jgi:hypothetical protein
LVDALRAIIAVIIDAWVAVHIVPATGIDVIVPPIVAGARVFPALVVESRLEVTFLIAVARGRREASSGRAIIESVRGAVGDATGVAIIACAAPAGCIARIAGSGGASRRRYHAIAAAADISRGAASRSASAISAAAIVPAVLSRAVWDTASVGVVKPVKSARTIYASTLGW